MKKVILSVTNDLVTDQRLDKTASCLANAGYEVLTVGRRYNDSPPVPEKKYQTKRLSLFFRKGFCFYAEFNLRLFFFLLFRKVDILVANDLDTLLPNFLVSKIRRKKIVYDSHEYFCGLPELTDRPRVRKVWLRIEKFCFPKLPLVITVSPSIAQLYDAEYPTRTMKVQVIRNVPSSAIISEGGTRTTFGLPEDKRIIVMQGAINIDRGAEELIEAMRFIPNALLLIIGNGDVIPQLKQRVAAEGLGELVRFIPRIAPEQLAAYTALADIGCSLEKDTNCNYRYCLPNKLFDYIRAGIPVVVSDLPEMAAVVRENGVGVVIPEHSPQGIALAVNQLLNDSILYQQCREQCRKSAPKYVWEQECRLLQELYRNL